MSVNRVLATMLCGLALVFSMPSAADMFSPSNSCSKPHKPYQFTEEWEVQQFANDVERYKRCIQDFVEEQRDQAKKHQDAVNEAIDEWNHFVQWELR